MENPAGLKRSKRQKVKLGTVLESPDSAFNRLNVRQKNFVKGVVLEGKTKRQSAMEAYQPSSVEVADKVACQQSKSKNVARAMIELYNAQGLERNLIAKTVVRGMKAKIHIVDFKKRKMVRTDAYDIDANLRASRLALDMLDRAEGVVDEKQKGALNVQININQSNEMEEAVKQHLKMKFGKSEVRIVSEREEHYNQEPDPAEPEEDTD